MQSNLCDQATLSFSIAWVSKLPRVITIQDVRCVASALLTAQNYHIMRRTSSQPPLSHVLLRRLPTSLRAIRLARMLSISKPGLPQPYLHDVMVGDLSFSARFGVSAVNSTIVGLATSGKYSQVFSGNCAPPSHLILYILTA